MHLSPDRWLIRTQIITFFYKNKTKRKAKNPQHNRIFNLNLPHFPFNKFAGRVVDHVKLKFINENNQRTFRKSIVTSGNRNGAAERAFEAIRDGLRGSTAGHKDTEGQTHHRRFRTVCLGKQRNHRGDNGAADRDTGVGYQLAALRWGNHLLCYQEFAVLCWVLLSIIYLIYMQWLNAKVNRVPIKHH